jgi:hypothetical protein
VIPVEVGGWSLPVYVPVHGTLLDPLGVVAAVQLIPAVVEVDPRLTLFRKKYERPMASERYSAVELRL